MAAILLIGCGKSAVVHVVDGANDKYACGPNRGAFLAPNGRVAVCMSQNTAEFVMCATAIGVGERREDDEANTGANLKVPGVGDLGGSRSQQRSRLDKESASAAILEARAEALRACTKILTSGDPKPAGKPALGGETAAPAPSGTPAPPNPG